MRSSLLFTATLVLFALAPGARAELISVPTAGWSYDFEPANDAVFADAPHDGSGVSFTNEASRTVLGASDVVVTNLRTFSLAPATDPAQLDTGGAYAFSMTITDAASGASATRNLTGKLGGTFSQDNANVTNEFTSDLEFSVPLGDYVYTVTLTTYSPPGPPSATNSGSITAHVDVFQDDVGTGVVDPPPAPESAPEPSTMILSCLGISLVGGATWRRRKARRRA
jgi:hypothetical protein